MSRPADLTVVRVSGERHLVKIAVPLRGDALEARLRDIARDGRIIGAAALVYDYHGDGSYLVVTDDIHDDDLDGVYAVLTAKGAT